MTYGIIFCSANELISVFAVHDQYFQDLLLPQNRFSGFLGLLSIYSNYDPQTDKSWILPGLKRRILNFVNIDTIMPDGTMRAPEIVIAEWGDYWV